MSNKVEVRDMGGSLILVIKGRAGIMANFQAEVSHIIVTPSMERGARSIHVRSEFSSLKITVPEGNTNPSFTPVSGSSSCEKLTYAQPKVEVAVGVFYSPSGP